jgi:hypothetical protein
MSIMTCLKNIIGVTNSDCACITGGLTSDQTADVKKSVSGLYMDDVEGGVSMKGLGDVDSCLTFYQMATRARDNGTQRLQDDLIIAISNRYKKNKNAFVGQIGRMSYAQSLGIAKPVQAIRMRPIDFSDAVLTISRMTIILNEVVTGLVVNIWRVPVDTVMGTLVNSFSVDTVANGYVTIPDTAPPSLPLSLPFVYQNQMVEYWITYDLTGQTAQPKDNQLESATCTKGVLPYSDYVQVYGAQLDSETNFSGYNLDTYAHGLILDADIRCNNEELVCREYSEDDAIAITMAYAARFKAAELLIEYVLGAPDINRYTTMAREYLWGKRNHFRAEYDARVLYLASTIDVTSSNCYVCRETANQPRVHGILT